MFRFIYVGGKVPYGKCFDLLDFGKIIFFSELEGIKL